MTVEAFNSLDDMHAFMAGHAERMNSQIKPWQQKVTYGDHFILFPGDDMPVIYGYIPTVAEFSNEDPFNGDRTVVFGKIFDAEENPSGIYESIHISQIDAIITEQQFKQLKVASWPRAMLTALRVMFTTNKRHPAFMLFRDGRALFSRAGRLVYGVLQPKGVAILDEGQLNDEFGKGNWNLVNDWKMEDSGKGVRMFWDSAEFEARP